MSAQQVVLTPGTRRLQILVAICSLVFAVGSALHNFAVVDTQLVEDMMRMAGVSHPVAAAAGFTAGFRVVGTVYIIGNALGVLALWSRARWLWWLLLAVNATQALGFAVIPVRCGRPRAAATAWPVSCPAPSPMAAPSSSRWSC
ncbi:hypothetical protein ACWCPO_06975 [Streptomyces albidoflavus]